jgi:PEP-CTERM motif
MINERNVEFTNPAPSRLRNRSRAAKLVQAAALAAMLVPLGSISAEGSTCTFGGVGSGTPCDVGPQGGLLFGFGSAPYMTELRFDQINGQFEVTITDVENTFAQITSRFTEFFAGYQPVPIGSNQSAPYIDFQVDAPGPGPDTWESLGPRGPGAILGYDLWIYWLADTNAMFPNPKVLHDTDGGSNQFDLDMTIPGSYSQFVPCGVFFPCGPGFPQLLGDPAVGGRDDMFTSITLAANNVPEPATLLLLASGISGLWYRRRQTRP